MEMQSGPNWGKKEMLALLLDLKTKGHYAMR